MHDDAIDRKKAAAWIEELAGLLLSTRFTNLAPSERRLHLLSQLEGVTITEGLWILSELHEVLALPGDICEFGCAWGATSCLMGNELLMIADKDPARVESRKMWLFDSFQGLPAPTEEDALIDDIFGLGSMEAYEGTMQADPSAVRQRLESTGLPLDRVVFVEGFIEDTIHQHELPKSVCFALVDFDFYRPIQIALDYLHGHLVPGGTIVVDDYGHFSAGAQKAVDEFVAEHPTEFDCIIAPEWAGSFAVLKRHG